MVKKKVEGGMMSDDCMDALRYGLDINDAVLREAWSSFKASGYFFDEIDISKQNQQKGTKEMYKPKEQRKACDESIAKYEERKRHLIIREKQLIWDNADKYGITFPNCPVCCEHGKTQHDDSCSGCILDHCSSYTSPLASAMQEGNVPATLKAIDDMIAFIKERRDTIPKEPENVIPEVGEFFRHKGKSGVFLRIKDEIGEKLYSINDGWFYSFQIKRNNGGVDNAQRQTRKDATNIEILNADFTPKKEGK